MLKKLEPLFSTKTLHSRTPIKKDVELRQEQSREQSSCAPDLRSLRPKGQTGSLRPLGHTTINPQITQKDKVHQKFKSEYNAFMNKLELGTNSSIPEITSNISEGFESIIPKPPLTMSLPSESILHSKEEKIQTTKIFKSGNKVPESGAVAPAGLRQESQDLRSGQESYTTGVLSPVLFPKFDDFESSCEILPKMYNDVVLSKKTVNVWLDGIEMTYKQFRNGNGASDLILFVLPPEPDLRSELDLQTEDSELQTETLNSYIFIGYSKKQLYEEYMLVGNDSFFILNIIEEESYMIPMYQIVRILEYSHVMYLLEKSDSGGLSIQDDMYMTHCRPCKFNS